MGIATGSMSILAIIYIIIFGISIFCMVLFIKVAIRGIKALDIYIDKNHIL